MVSALFFSQLVLVALVWLCLSIRQHVAAIGRRISALCKGEDDLRQQLSVSQEGSRSWGAPQERSHHVLQHMMVHGLTEPEIANNKQNNNDDTNDSKDVHTTLL